jgi:MFS family permease
MSDLTASMTLEPKQKVPAPFRWLVLCFVSLAMFGNYYVYDCVEPLADILKSQLHFSDQNIGLMQAIYSAPNIFMVLIGGFIIDRIGARKATLIFSLICLVGAILTAVKGSVGTMAAGRLFFGLGAESLIVAVTTALAKWFRGRQLSFAFGLNLTISRLGTYAAQTSPLWAAGLYLSWQKPLLMAVGFAAISAVSAILYYFLESSLEKRFSTGKAAETDKVVFKDIWSFGKSFWFIVALCITFYSAIFPFLTFAYKFFIEAHQITRENASVLVSSLTLAAMIFTPLFGLLVDRVGRRSLFMMFGSLLLMPVYLMLAYSKLPLYIPMAMMGIAFSLIPAIMWPSVAYVVDQSKLGTAYGLMTMIQNIGLTAFNWMIGWANDYSRAGVDNPRGYILGMWIFSSLGVFGFFFAWLLRRNETGPAAHGLETITTKNKGTVANE